MDSFLKIGLPMISFCVVGAYGLSKLNQGRYDNKARVHQVDHVDTRKKKKEFDLEREYELMMREVDLEKWENKHIARRELEE